MRILTAAAVLSAGAAVMGAENAARYEAVFDDGARISGDSLQGWGLHPGTPRLGDTALNDAGRPLRWFRDRTLAPWSATYRQHAVEFVGGDRIVGRLQGVRAGDGPYTPLHLLIKPAGATTHRRSDSSASVRVLPERIQRVVFQSESRRPLNPGMLYYRDGRKQPFERLRWKGESAVLLTTDGAKEVKFVDVSEIHLPRIDPWKAYYRELAVLSPACRVRLMRVETSDGLIVTGSSMRFGAMAHGTPSGRHAAEANIKQAMHALETVRGREKSNRLKVDKSRARHEKQVAETQRLVKAAEKALQTELAATRKRFGELQKSDEDKLKKQQALINKQLQDAAKAMQETLQTHPPEERDRKLRAFRDQQAGLRKSRQNALAAERKKLRNQRSRELRKAIEAGTKATGIRIKELRKKPVDTKNQLDRETAQWRSSRLQVDSARARLESLRNGRKEAWTHIIQPVWSLDPLWIRFTTIRMRWSFDPTQVPLCRVRASSTVSPPFLPNRTNTGWTGGMLRSGRRDYAWGFAVHAYSELRFALPQSARAFRCRVGLDNVVGPGGCARARVYVGSTKNKPSYASELLIGTDKTVDTGPVRLEMRPDDPKLLILQADPADRDGPPGADPVNIRDKLNWLDPQLELDRAMLREQVRDQVGPLLAATEGWKILIDPTGRYAWTSFFHEKGSSDRGSFWPMIQAIDKPLKLRRKMTVGPSDRHLTVHLGLPTDISGRIGVVTLRADKREIPARSIPIRQVWRTRPTPLVFDLKGHQGKTVTLELTQPAGGKPLHWQAIGISNVPPPEYRLVDSLKAIGKKDMEIPCGLARVLQKANASVAEKRSAVEIHELGGIVNFTPEAGDPKPADSPVNIMLGREWTGGDKAFDKAFDTFRKITSLKTLLVTSESGVSSGAVARLRGRMPGLKVIRMIPRLPSPRQGAFRPTTWRNHTNAPLVIIWIDQKGKLAFSSTSRLQAGQTLKRSCFFGVRYEAHYVRDNAREAKDYIYSQPVSTFQMAEGAVWEIRPDGARNQ